MIAEDWGDSDVFKKAIVAMSEITDEFVFHVGLVGDYGALAVRLIKAFDAGGVLRHRQLRRGIAIAAEYQFFIVTFWRQSLTSWNKI